MSEGWAPYLAPGEEVLWQGRPRPGVVIRAGDLPQMLFGLVFFAFSVFWMIMAGWMGGGTGGPFGLLFPLFGLPFVAVGFYMAGGRLLWDVYKNQHMWYSLTNRRAIIATEVFGQRAMKDYRITPDTVLEFRDGAPASIYFGYEEGGSSGARRKVGFLRIDDGQEVYAMMRRIQREAAAQ